MNTENSVVLEKEEVVETQVAVTEEATVEEVAPVVEAQLETSVEETNSEETSFAENPAENSAENPAENLLELNTQELCDMLFKEMETTPIEQLKNRVEEVKIIFYKKIKQQDETERVKFTLEGGNPEDFKAEVSPVEIRFKELLGIYRDNRNKHTAQSEEEQQQNYKAKLEIIEELKSLIDSTETMGATFAAFKELQDKWRAIGPVPIAVNKELWNNYHHHTENFYNYVKINRELRDMDLKRNYDAKLKLCEEAEKLQENKSVINAFNSLQKLHEEYRELGPVAQDKKEELWERFKIASTVINKLHQEHYDKIKEQQLENLAKKSALCQEVEQIVQNIQGENVAYKTLKEWNAAQEILTNCQVQWKTIGFAPKKDNNEIYERFRAACDKFFSAKREFFAHIKTEQSENIKRKKELILAAEELSESTDWKAATDSILELQAQWKASGNVSRKDSEILWKKFRSACDKFFERKSENFQGNKGKTEEVLAAKQDVLTQLNALKGSAELSFDKLKELMHSYGAAGFLPKKQKEELQVDFMAVCDELFEELRAKEGIDRIEKFRQKVAQSSTKGAGVNSTERDGLNGRLRALQNELKTLENNIGFFAMSKGADALKADVERKITKVKNDINEVKEKIKILNS